MKSAKWWMGLCVAGCLCAAAGASAALPRASETTGGVEWTFSIGDNGAIVTAASPATGALAIPSNLGGQPVVEIGYAAFASCEELTAVIIPAGVKSIADRAFQYCSLLERVTIPESVTNIGTMAFQYCESLPSLALPQGLDSIGTNACYHCTGMQKLYVPLAWWGTSKASAAGANCTVVYGEPDKETVVFDPNGGSCGTDQCTYPLGESYGWLPEATRDGYAFDGWFTEYNGGDRISAATTVTASETRTLYAHWTLVEQLVTFDANGGQCDPPTHSYAIGGTYGWFPTPTRDGCAFIGWQTPDRKELAATSVVPEQRSLTLQARWLQCSFDNEIASVTGLIPTDAIGTLSIPSECQGYLITSIGYGAFRGCNDLVSVTIPDSVTSIGVSAFFGCGGLTSVTIPDSVTSIGDWAFFVCYGLTSVTIPESVTNIGSQAFAYCDGLTSVTIPDGVTNIGDWAFHGCSGLTSVTILGNVTSGWTPNYPPFSNCTNLSTLVLGEKMTKIGDCMFSGCSGLTNVTIPDSVTSIGYAAFRNCSALTSVTIGDGVTSIGNMAFRDCSGLTGVTIGDSVTNIGDYAFYYCTSLASVTIPGSVTSIGSDAFYNCSGLTSVTVPDSVRSIGSGAFCYCSALTSVTIGDSVTSIGDNAFSACGSLATFSVGSENPAYRSISDLLLTEDGKTLICGVIGDVVIPDSVTTIASRAFFGCSGLTSVTIPDSVASIGDWAFFGCSSLATFSVGSENPAYRLISGLLLTKDGTTLIRGVIGDVVIPDSVTSIGSGAFSGCSGLTSVTIPDSVASIGSVAFYGCSGLASVTIPDSVTSIGSTAFSGCTSTLFDTNSIPGVHLVDGWAVGYSESLAGTLDLTGVRGMAESAFYNCSGLTSVTIPDSVTSIGGGVFYGCNGLASVTIPDGVTSIGDWAFGYCSGLESVTIPDSVTSIGDWAFGYCSGLAGVAISDNVANIGSYAFYYCTNLTSVTIGDSVTSIGDSAFCYCNALTSVTIPENVTSIGRSAFRGCSALKTLYAPESWETKYVDVSDEEYYYDYVFWDYVFWSDYAGVPSDCEIIYYAPPKTSTGVPYAWLEEQGLGDGTAEGYEAAAAADAANGSYKVWECYVAGLDPADPAARFTAEIGFTNGTPVVTWTPDLNEKGGKSERSYQVEGRTTMTDEWGATNAASRFFRVRVGLP